MPKYNVRLPVCGYVDIEVEAATDKEAIDKALETEWGVDDVEELEAYRRLFEGNVTHVWHHTAEASRIKGEDEDV